MNFEEELDRLEHNGLLRRLECVDSPQGPRITLSGRPFLLMAGNNYLDLANHPDVRQAAIEGILRYGVGSGASRLISGTQRPHKQLEQRLARFKGTEAALVFSTGYMANLAAIDDLLPKDGLILLDRLCHASLIDGSRLSGRRYRTFAHNNLDRLESLLVGKPSGQPALIVTEGVFSMEGDVPPLPELLALARRHGARVLLDDAHGLGVMGKTGRGTIEHFGLDPSAEDLIQMATMGKALGGFGAFIAGPRKVIDYLLNKARSFIYTTAPPPALCSAAIAALDIIEKEPERRARLWTNREFLFQGLRSLGFELLKSETPILPVAFPDLETGSAFSSFLHDHGIWAPVIRPPSVPRGTSRLRMTVMAGHTREDLESVLSVMGLAREKCLPSPGTGPAVPRGRLRPSPFPRRPA